MDYLLLMGMSKMPKIPDKNNSQFFLVKPLEKRLLISNSILI